jgi:hypothetical protein
MAKKRDWKKYEKELGERKQKIVDFIMSRPTKEEVLRELEKLNKRKPGRRFEAPKSILLFFHFLKHLFRIDDRTLARFMSCFMNVLIPRDKPFDHSTVVKRRKEMDLPLPFDITPEKLNGKRLYFDGMCLRVGRGGYYRSKRYKTDVKYLRIALFTDNDGRVVDFSIGNEHDSEVNMVKEKLRKIERSKAEAFVSDGASSIKDVVVGLVQNGIKPIIRASVTVVGSMKNRPLPGMCLKRKKEEELIWEDYARQQQDYQKWRKETGYSSRWVYSEGKISSFKRMFGEETLCRTQKSLHDEICLKFMLLDGVLPRLGG